MNDIAAGIGLVQLKKLDAMNDKRRRIVERYNEAFKNLPWLRTPIEKNYAKNAYWMYVVRIEKGDRDKFMEHLLREGVSANTSFKPLHLFTFYREYYQREEIKVECPVAEQEWKKLAVLPLYPDMTIEELSSVIEAVRKFKPE